MKVKNQKERRKTKVRKGIAQRGRGRKLTVSRSNKYVLAQIVDIPSGKTLVSFDEKKLVAEKPKLTEKTKTERAFEVGKKIGKIALKKGIKSVAFDRGRYPYHGRIKAVAEGAREGGLKI